MIKKDEIKKYWEKRAAADSSAQSTTQDYYLREIEVNVLCERLGKYSPILVADVGCGDGRTTLRIANDFRNTTFLGFDYAPSMVKNAQANLISSGLSNVKFEQFDICGGLKDSFHLIYSTRCLINLPSWDLQKVAINNIHNALNESGVYLMIENFIETHNGFNQIRKDFGLSEIPVRDHNLFFQRQRLLDYIDFMFTIEEEVNISSTYYLVSRVVYSKICSELGQAPNYLDDHHRFAARLPFCGEYGPVRLISFKKK